VACATAASLQERREAAVRAVYANLVYPNPIPLVHSNGTAATFFHPNVTGRITPIGVFSSRQDTVEYFYALANPVFGNISTGDYRSIQNDIRILDLVGVRASVQANIHLARYPSTDTEYNLTQTGWFGFNPDEDAIAWYDLTIIRVDQAANKSPSTYNITIQVICQQIQERCTGPYQQYEDVDNCTAFLHSIDFGSWGNAYSDTVVCRGVHNTLTQVRPEYHCAHVGPTGGERCVFHSYQSWYDTEYVVNLPPDTVPDPFTSIASTLLFTIYFYFVMLLNIL